MRTPVTQLVIWKMNGGYNSVCHLSIPYPYQATCKTVGGGQRVCTCPPHFGGDGFSCYGDIIQVRGVQSYPLPLCWPPRCLLGGGCLGT